MTEKEVSIDQNERIQGTSRLEAFSDGVFAIAITLLVLDIHVPGKSASETLFQLLLHDWTTYVAFLIGFFTILICWINHHFMFRFIDRSNGVLLVLNGLKLLIVSFTPFVTALISRYIQTEDQQTAVSIYALNFAFMGSCMFGLWFYAYRKGFAHNASKPTLRMITKLYVFAIIIPAVIFMLSFISISWSIVFFVLMFMVFIFPEKTISLLDKRNHRASGDVIIGG